MKCPCCKKDEDLGDGDKLALFKRISLATDWGLEGFFKCLNCGIIWQEVKESE
jgi:hypothetical protein